MKITFVFLFFLLTSNIIFGQDNQMSKNEIKQKINDLFTSMRSSDSLMIRHIFSEEAVLKSTYIDKAGKSAIHTGIVQDFIDAVSTPKTDYWDERISNLTIHVDDNLAVAWMNYSFYLNNEFSHCGVNAIELIKFEHGWRITNLTDTRRNEACNN